MKRFLQSGLIFAGVLGIAAVGSQADQDITKNRKKFDLRESILRKFMRDRNCPTTEYSETFISEADRHGLDWRLLPSLAFVESSCGKAAKGNNIFGWANGKMNFTSIGDAIHTVASALAHGRAYRDKDIDAKLSTYNHGTDYRAMVREIMNQISPRQEVEATD